MPEQLSMFPDINLCEEIISSMIKLEFDQEFIDYIQENEKYYIAYNSPPAMQRIALVTVFYRLLLNTVTPVPESIRLALNSAGDMLGWLTDIKLVILPWLKENRSSIVLT